MIREGIIREGATVVGNAVLVGVARPFLCVGDPVTVAVEVEVVGDAAAVAVGHALDVPASVELTGLKGPTDPDARAPGQLRHLLGRYSYLLNLVHTPDEPADVLRELGAAEAAVERGR